MGRHLLTLNGSSYRQFSWANGCFRPQSGYTIGIIFSEAYSCFRPRLCENAKSENPSGKLPPIYYILRLENGFQWSVQVLTRPVMQRYPTCEKIQIVFTQPRPIADYPGFWFGRLTHTLFAQGHLKFNGIQLLRGPADMLSNGMS